MEISLSIWKLDNKSISALTLQHWLCLLKAVWVHMHLCLSLCQRMCMCCFHVFLSCTVCTKWCHQCTCAQARLGKIRAYAFLHNNYCCVYAPAGLLVSGVIFYSLLPTLKDWKLMGGLNGPVFVCFKLMRKIRKDAWCDDQNTYGMLRWRHSSLRNHKISKFHHVVATVSHLHRYYDFLFFF